MYKLSMYQVFIVTSSSYLPLLFWVFPRYAAYYGGVDGQWALLCACLIALVSAFIHGLLNTRFPTASGADMPSLVYGKVVGKAVSLMFLPGYMLFVAASIYSFSISIKSLLPNTPRLATVIALTCVAAMGAAYGLETISRAASIIFPVTLFILGASFVLLFFKGNWTGVFFSPVSISHSMTVGAQLLPIFFGLNLYLMLSPYYDHRNRNAFWLPVVSVGVSSVVIMSVFIITIRMIGYEGLRLLVHPNDFILQLATIQGLVIQRFGVVLVFIATMFETVFFANHLWALSELTRRTVEFKKSSEKWFVAFYAVSIIIISQLITNQQMWDWLILQILVPLCWVYLIIEPTVKLILSYILAGKRRRVPRH